MTKETCADAPAFVIRERVPILLKQGVDARDAAVPRVFKVLERETPVLRVGLLAFERILGPDALRVEELALPGLDVAVEVRDHLAVNSKKSVPKYICYFGTRRHL